MKVIKNENNVFVDVDGTIILAIDPNKPVPGRTVNVFDAVSKRFIKMKAHEPNIRLLLEEKHRGSHVIVWSKGGYEWAANVLRALDLEKYVDLVITKPSVYFDDIPIEKWLPARVYLEPDMIYKK